MNEVIEKVDNALKLFGDVYLVKVYNVASETFQLSQWKKSVNQKLSAIEDIYGKLNDRVHESRLINIELWLVILEILIVLLFVIDIWLYFLEPFK